MSVSATGGGLREGRTMTESSIGTGTGFVARYRPGIGTKFAIRGWIVAVAFTVVLGAIVIPVMVTTGNIGWGIVACVFVLIAVLWAAFSAANAPQRWGADDRLAIAISDAGVTVPSVGLLEWDRIVGFKVFDMGNLTGNVFIAGIQFFNGTRDHQEITIYTRGDMTSAARKLDLAGRKHVRVGLEKGTVGYATAWGLGLSDPSVAQVAAAVEAVAARRGLPVAH
jgi:hypothetical protein